MVSPKRCFGFSDNFRKQVSQIVEKTAAKCHNGSEPEEDSCNMPPVQLKKHNLKVKPPLENIIEKLSW